jgi:cystathionine beta-synthase
MRSLGAEVIIVPKELKPDHPESLLNKAKAVARERPGAWWADQFGNPANVAVHYETTGPEIWSQSVESADAFVVGVGTGGSLTGAGRFLREKNLKMQIVLADPQGSILANVVETGRAGEPGASIVEGIGGSVVPANADLTLVSHAVRVPDIEAVQAARRLLETEGIFAGASAGCILAATLRFCRLRGAGGDSRPLQIVALIPDGGRAYLSTLHDEAWRREHGFSGRIDW